MRWLVHIMMIVAFAACGSTPDLVFSDPESLAAAYDLYGAHHAGDVVLQRTIKVTVDSAVKPSDAESRFEVQVALARYTPSQAPLTVEVVTPKGAALGTVRARLQGQPIDAMTAGPASDVVVVDPGQVGWRFTFAAPSAAPAPREQLVLELIVGFTIDGTLASDAQWVAGPGLDTVLLRYDLPGDTQGTFQVTGADLKPLVTTQGGRTVIALLVRSAYQYKGPVIARYATLSASPKGYEQRYADSWAGATRDLDQRLVKASDALDEGYAAPFSPTTSGDARVAEIYTWVRDRRQRPDALASAWDAARGLKAPVETNDLTATDKVHLLHWLLREAHVPHRFAMARPVAYTPLPPGSIPVPGAFTTPLVFAGGVWLDPACTTCAPGEVRPELSGAQALLLPVASAPELLFLPSEREPTP